jgi:linoleoyl-CoA desaturase
MALVETMSSSDPDPAASAVRLRAPLRFRRDSAFRQLLNQRVRAYFAENGLARRGCTSFYVKAAIMIAWVVASYILLVFGDLSFWSAAAVAIMLGLGITFLTFNIVHDAGHRAISRRPAINQAAATLMDLVGASSYVWMQKHNLVHHTYPNIHEYDCDIDQWPLSRFSPHQPHLWFHRFQHLYLWPLYGLTTIKWQWVDDFKPLLAGRVGVFPFARPRGAELVRFMAGKLVFFALAFGLPLALHPVPAVLGLYFLTFYVHGMLFIIVAQLSHMVTHTVTPRTSELGAMLDVDFAVHQAQASCDFCQHNKVLTWLLGGLNFQVEHHLFPGICHVHYPAIAPIVRDVCGALGVPYNTHLSLLEGLKSHHQHLRTLARKPDAVIHDPGMNRAPV